jgi:hypothetical protein
LDAIDSEDQVISDLKEDNYQIKILNQAELKYFWNIIFYNIEEPLFIIESPKIKFICDFLGNDKIFIEAM